MVPADLDAEGHVRVAYADRSLHRFDFNDNEQPVFTLANLPSTLTPDNFQVTFDRLGGFYFCGNRVQAINLGPTNLAALTTGQGYFRVIP